MSEKKTRKPRADALRNREHILSVAREAFASQGDQVTLDDIVRLSGLGVGTLYRHFPTRDALLEALYWSELEKLAAAEKELSASLPPLEALRQWLLLFVDMIAAKLALKEALNGMVGGTAELYAASSDLLQKTATALLERAGATGEIRMDMDPLDLLRALGGVATTSPGPNWQDNARKMVDVLIAGMRV
jgi:AcrR family transcriptional regulator